MHQSNIACDEISKKYIILAFEKLSITSSDKPSSQTKSNIEKPPLLQT